MIVPYRVSLTINHPEDRDVVTVFHADGQDEVKIEACGDELAAYTAVVGGGGCPEGADEATGFSKALSFDEAFADALAKLPTIEPEHPDTLETVRVIEIGGCSAGSPASTTSTCASAARTTDPHLSCQSPYGDWRA